MTAFQPARHVKAFVHTTIDSAGAAVYHPNMVSDHTNKGAASIPTVGRPVAREPSLSERVAGHLMDRILEDAIEPGVRLPPERALAEQYGVSRTVIREAVRTLVSKGLLETRGGSGTYVRAGDAAAVGASLSPLLHARLPYVMVHEVRVVLETEAAGLAARRAEPRDVAAMEREVARLRQAAADADAAAASATDAAFHLALGTATHNEMFPLLAQLIAAAMAEARNAGFAVPGAYHNALAHHQRILAAVQTHDAPSAIRAMRAHLGDAQSILRQGLEMATSEQRDR